jgi:hypothetical protein
VPRPGHDASIYTPCNAWEMVMFRLIVMVSMKTKKLRCYKVTGTATQSRLQNYKLQTTKKGWLIPSLNLTGTLLLGEQCL